MSLIGLLQAIDYSQHDVDLFVYSHRGELMQHIPKEVHLLPEIPAYAHIERPMKEALKNGHLGIVAARLMSKWKYRKYKKRVHPTEGSAIFQYVDNEVCKVLPSLKHFGTYDLAISFLTPHGVVLKKVNAKKKAAWIHTDYSKIGVDVDLEYPIWNGYDHIVSISQDVTKAFLTRFPTLKDKIVEIENILSPAFVRRRADEIPEDVIRQEMPREEGVINLLSVGRFSYPKNYDNVPMICKMINDKAPLQLPRGGEGLTGLRNDNDNCLTDLSSNNSQFSILNSQLDNVPVVPPLSGETEGAHSQFSILNSQLDNVPVKIKWFLIGFGGDEALIRRKIAEADMEDDVIILGKKSNPYPYIKACDIYVQPSRFEGKSVTVREAQMLCKPVIVTDYPTASSQVHHGQDGIIVPLENTECAHAISQFIQNQSLQDEIKAYLYAHDYGNTKESDKINQLID